MDSARVFYIIGASGSGKDSLITYVRKNIRENMPVVFAHRYITRPYKSGGENHIELSEQEFEHRKQHGCFAMHWKSHKLQYGIGAEINQWLVKGLHVVVNGSRAYLETARYHYPELLPVLVRVDTAVLRERLISRNRESEEQIEERIRQAELLDKSLSNTNISVVDNNGCLEKAGDALIRMIESRKVRQCA